MKLGYKLLFGACVAANLIATSCVDDMKFGNSFLDKARVVPPQWIRYSAARSIPSSF